MHESTRFAVFNNTCPDSPNENIYQHWNTYIILYSFPPISEERWPTLLCVIPTVSLLSYLFHRGIAALRGLSCLYYTTTTQMFGFFYHWISESGLCSGCQNEISFLCVFNLMGLSIFLACCFDGCPQQHGQSSFCCGWLFFFWDRPPSDDLTWSLGTASEFSGPLIILCQQNKQPRKKAQTGLCWPGKLKVQFSPLNQFKSAVITP